MEDKWTENIEGGELSEEIRREEIIVSTGGGLQLPLER